MTDVADLRAALGPLGIWANLNAIPLNEALAFARTAEDLGSGALWIHEGAGGREPFAVLGALAGATHRVWLGVGIASIYARDASAAHAGARTIAELSGGRFVMGLGVSHRSSVTARGHEYAAPLPAMRAYLDAYDAAAWTGTPVDGPPLVVAALGPGMLRLAARRSAGAFPFLVTPEYVRSARTTVDEAVSGEADRRPLLVVSVPAILGRTEDVMPAARASVSYYLRQPNYRNNLERIGFAVDEIDGASDRLVRALVATGDPGALRARIDEYRVAGADHVAVIPLSTEARHADLATARAILAG